MLQTGIDLIEVARIEATIAQYGERFLNRVYCPAELEYCRARPHQLAARFAAKEAVAKVLGVGIQHADGVAWNDIEVISGARGKPAVQLKGKAAQRADELNLKNIALSLSHTHEHAIAMVIAEQAEV
ncbi:MAG: holo-ACP synthase [Chloroflexi bacterium]|nr:holo-ACP synthase [Chloroflexota bacterium]